MVNFMLHAFYHNKEVKVKIKCPREHFSVSPARPRPITDRHQQDSSDDGRAGVAGTGARPGPGRTDHLEAWAIVLGAPSPEPEEALRGPAQGE